MDGDVGSPSSGGQSRTLPKSASGRRLPRGHQPAFFVFENDAMRGPLSLDALKELLRKGQVDESSLIWRLGLATWVELKNIPDLHTIALAIRPEGQPESVPQKTPIRELPPAPNSDRLAAPIVPTKIVSREAPPSSNAPNPFLEQKAVTEQNIAPTVPEVPEAPSSLVLRLAKSWPLRIALGLAIAAITTAGLLHAKLTAPAEIGVWRSSGFLSDERFEAFEKAATAIPLLMGTRLEIEPVSDPSDPRILVATNLPDGSVLGVTLQGIEGQLVGSLSYSYNSYNSDKSEAQTQVTNGTAVIRLASTTTERPPTGFHRISIVCSTCRSSGANAELPLVAREIFLGPRSTFERELEKYHASIRQQLQLELDEIRQLLETLVNQVDETNGTYHLLRQADVGAKEAATSLAAWNQFSTSWSRLQRSMEANVKRFDLRESGGVFHYAIYRRALEALTLSLHLHQLQATDLAKPLASRAREIDDTEQLLRAHVTSLWAKVTRAQQDLGQTSGLPERPAH